MIAQLSKMIDDAHRAGLAYRRVIDRSVGLTDVHRPATKPRRAR
ncbi:MAG: hypothetical protein ABWZ02_03245 [Nakamurella sp.]